jgi:hypothetical protein
MKRLTVALLVLVGSAGIHPLLWRLWISPLTGLWQHPRYVLSVLGVALAGAWVASLAGTAGPRWFAGLFVASVAVQSLIDLLAVWMILRLLG